MKKLALIWLCIVMVVFVATCPIKAENSLSIGAIKNCNLEINYAYNGKSFSNVDVSLYRIAKMESDGSFTTISPYSDYNVSIYGVSTPEDWKDVASTFSSYITADDIPPFQIRKTSKTGKATFKNIEAGLYLVGAVSANYGESVCYFDNFMLYLPEVTEDGYNYNTTAKPKGVIIHPTPEKEEYKIVKLWKDVDNKNNRPSSVKVDIIKDGALYKTITLSAKNHWFYTFKGEKGSVFTVVERKVPKNYRVRIALKNNSFTITNTYKDNEGKKPPYKDGPSMGDNFPIMLYVVIMSISGIIMFLIGIGSLRGRKNAKEK